MATTNIDKTPLEQLKQIEKKQKEMLLNKSLKRLKELCKLVLKTKERVNSIMEILGLPEKDAKGIIDWINSLSDVQLSDDDKKEIRTEEIDTMQDKKEEVEEESEKYWRNIMDSGSAYTLTSPSLSTLATSAVWYYAWTANNAIPTQYVTSGGLEIKC